MAPRPSPLVGEGVVSLGETTGEGYAGAEANYPLIRRLAEPIGTFSHKGRRLKRPHCESFGPWEASPGER
jgi:hypothetical protein